MIMKDNFNINLERVIFHLPDYSPDEDLWNKISNELDFDQRICRQVKSLPVLDHEKDFWIRIEQKLNQDSKITGNRIRRIITWSISVAASLLLVILYITRITLTPDIVFSEEYQLKESFISFDLLGRYDPVTFLKQLCNYSTEKCADPLFESKMSRLIELDTEIKHLHEIVDAYGESPSLIKSLIIMENQKASLLKELLKTLRT